ncbi:hypothetical protein AB7C87_14510 [Natrarchaeobius sp. A-rgal3]|uniref:hypothetical protein n=1 Tax=Natrarchaeobius versutus TaxID=1679078 RepID=UPI003510A28C
MSSSPDGSADDASNLESSTLNSDESADDAGDVDAHPICYRCDRALEGERWFRLAARPGTGVADAYETVSRRCCPDCVAAMGMLEIVVDPRSRDAG